MDEYIISLQEANIYQREARVLSDVEFKINKGELVYVIGKVGSGKSSLLKTLYADLPLYEGMGMISGFNLMRLKNKQIPMLRRKIGVVFQDFQLLTDRSVFDNLAFVLSATGWKSKKGIKSRVYDVLNDVELGDKIDKMPHQLSGGEQQRIVIARALLNDPEVILADEPTGNLDPDTSESILNLLNTISKNGRTVVIATHNYDLLKKFPGRTFRCENEKLSEMKQSMEEIDFAELE